MATWIRLLIVAGVVLALTACATSKEDVFPQDGPDMASIYNQHQRSAGLARDPSVQRHGQERRIARGTADLHDFTQQAANEIAQVFPLLPNPQMVMFVFPHLSAEGAPVPGYTTAFPMYAVDHYAMPGEVYQP